MKTCPNHPDIAFTADECPVCLAEQGALSVDAIRMIFDSLDTIFNILTGSKVNPTAAQTADPEPDMAVIKKPATMEEAFTALNLLGKRDLNNAHREITGAAVERGEQSGPIIARIVSHWFKDQDGEKTEEPAMMVGEPTITTTTEETPEPGQTAAEYLAVLRKLETWDDVADVLEDLTGTRPAAHIQDVDVRSMIMTIKFGADWRADGGEE